MRIWRICKAPYAPSAFTGDGARRFSGRWHRSGTPVVYTSSSRSLAALEFLVHTDPDLAPADLVLIPADLDETYLRRLDLALLAPDWSSIPAQDSTRDLGDRWIESGDGLALEVPSIVMPGESNILVNPRHPAFSDLDIREAEPFSFDPRLLPRT